MDAPARVLAAESRAKAMLRLHDELPYDLSRNRTWRRARTAHQDRSDVVCRPQSQRKIAIGAKGQTIRTIGELARKEMEAAFDRRIHLFLHVKVREGWADERAVYQRLGLDWDA